MVDHWPKSYSLSQAEENLNRNYRGCKIDGEGVQVYLSHAELEMVNHLRMEQQMLGNEELSISSNQKAVEDIAKLREYMIKENMSNHTVDYIIECHTRQKNLLKEYHGKIDAFDEYQEAASKTAIYPGKGTALGLIYCALKLTGEAGEAGEVSENVGKALRDDGLAVAKPLTKERAEKIILELGDVLWYVSQTAKELDYTLEEVASKNLNKLASRQERGTLQGSGDER